MNLTRNARYHSRAQWRAGLRVVWRCRRAVGSSVSRYATVLARMSCQSNEVGSRSKGNMIYPLPNSLSFHSRNLKCKHKFEKTSIANCTMSGKAESPCNTKENQYHLTSTADAIAIASGVAGRDSSITSSTDASVQGGTAASQLTQHLHPLISLPTV
jgi:hypothetical protein